MADVGGYMTSLRTLKDITWGGNMSNILFRLGLWTFKLSGRIIRYAGERCNVETGNLYLRIQRQDSIARQMYAELNDQYKAKLDTNRHIKEVLNSGRLDDNIQ
jgi:hypothetical protein